MKVQLLVDKKIKDSDREEVCQQFSDLVEAHTGIKPKFFVRTWDYSNVPTKADPDGDLKPTDAYLKDLTDAVHERHDTYGMDSVVMWVHRDNWKFRGIWGQNISNVYHQYHLHLCRFDHHNLANSLGTLYHEWMHSLDALIKTHTNIEIDHFFTDVTCFENWDSSVVHANRFRGCKDIPYTYIRHKDNTEALERIAVPLREAYKKRRELAEKKIDMMETVVQLLEKKVTLLRALLNRKRTHKGV